MTAVTAEITTEHTPDLAHERTWQDAVCTLIDHFCASERCFSSGELARIVRIERADLRFAVTELGEFVKDLFHQGAIEYRDRHGRVTIAVQVPRRTVGRSRTPAGTEVFVYAPSPALGRDHDFEVEVPRPTFTPTDLERHRFAAAAAQANAEMFASVHGDGRLCIPRRAFEQLSHASGVAIRGGDEVFLELGTDAHGRREVLRVYLSARPGCFAYGLSPERGRVRFSAPGGLPGFVPGERFPITVENDALCIVLAHSRSYT
jgi:hypothetical protein